MKSDRAKACDISKKVKDTVWDRDDECCIICGSHYAMPNAHFVPRSKGGLGVEENIVTMCEQCHFEFDHTARRKEIGLKVIAYLKKRYKSWDARKLVYHSWLDDIKPVIR